MNDKIVSITPATGWYARFGAEGEGGEVREPVACWAIMTDDPALVDEGVESSTWIAGMVPRYDGGFNELVSAATLPDFLGFALGNG